MKILAFTDYHENETCINEIKKKAEQADILICCGDFTIGGGEIEKQLLILNKIGKPVLLIPGNHEEDEPLEEYCEELENITYIDRRAIEIDGLNIFGYGGGGFNTRDKELEKILPELKKHLKEPSIIITHAPPYGTKLDNLPYFGHVGNKSITKLIKEIKPKILLCGHLHEFFGKKQKIGNTLVINPGPVGSFIEIKK